jgi:signal transduction histidine kinase
MTRPSVAATIRMARPAWRTVAVAGLVVLSGLLAVVFALEQAGPTGLAWWWPSAAVGAVAAAASPARWRWMTAIGVGLASALGSAVADRPLLVVVLGGIGTAAEAWLVGTAVSGESDRPRLTTLMDVGRFAVAVISGAALVAALIGIGREFTGGAFLDAFWIIGASHLSAMVLIAPLGLIAIPRSPSPHWWRSAMLTVAMLGATALAFFPGTPVPVPILAMPLIAWAAVAEPMFFVAVQLLAVVGTAAGLTVMGGGVYPMLASQIPTATALQLFTICLGATTLAISASQNDRRALESKQMAISHLLHDAFRQSKSGFVILQEEGADKYSVLEVNAAAVVMLRSEFERTDAGRWQLRADALLRPWLAQATYDVSVTVDWEDVAPGNTPATITIDAVNRSGLNRVLLVSVQDLRPLREAEREMEWRLERERQVSRTFQALTQQKVDFVASVTHELRTPITSILGFAEELSETTADPAVREQVDVILRNASRLRGVIDDVLLVSKLSRAPATTDALPVTDAGLALQRSIEDAKHSIRHRELTVVTEIEDDLPVHGREIDLTRVFTNILTNAIKFSPDRGTIAVVAYRTDHQVVVTITDQGEGISEEDLAHIFDRFYRSPSSTRRGVPGTGLGLAIVKELLSGMEGRIELARADPIGTCAQITLPVADVDASA